MREQSGHVFGGVIGWLVLALSVGACASSPSDDDAAGSPSRGTSAPAPTPTTPAPAPSSAQDSPGQHGLAWGRPERVSNHRLHDPEIPAALIRVNGRDALTVWVSPVDRSSSRVEAASRTDAGRWQPATIIGPAARTHIYRLEAALGPDGSAAVAWSEPSEDASSSRVLVVHREGGDWGAPHELGEGEVGGIAIDRAGAVTVVWTAPDDGSVPPAVLASRLEEEQWDVPQVVAMGFSPEVAVSGTGELAVACTTYQGVGVTVRRHDTGRWDDPVNIRGIPFPDDARVAIDDRGRALVVWARSTDSESYARRHLAWSQTRTDGTWSPARFLDERVRRNVIGDFLGLSMNSRGQAIAAWSPTSVDEGGFRVARFTFRDGWTSPVRLAEYAFEPTTFMSSSGTAIVTRNIVAPPDWFYRESGGRWTKGGRITSREPLDSFGDGQRMAVFYRAGPNLTARFLTVPAG